MFILYDNCVAFKIKLGVGYIDEAAENLNVCGGATLGDATELCHL